MKANHPKKQPGKAVARVVSVVGLLVVWTVVWANLPSKQELLSAKPALRQTEPTREPQLDLTIPGVSSERGEPSTPAEGLGADQSPRVVADPRDNRARQIAEVKCEAEVQQSCPDTLVGESRRRCVMQRLKQLDAPCQQIFQQRLVRWKEAEGFRVACAEDMTRVCRTIQPGEGRILQCLQEHEQELSERCYRSLPKGRLQTRN